MAFISATLQQAFGRAYRYDMLGRFDEAANLGAHATQSFHYDPYAGLIRVDTEAGARRVCTILTSGSLRTVPRLWIRSTTATTTWGIGRTWVRHIT